MKKNGIVPEDVFIRSTGWDDLKFLTEELKQRKPSVEILVKVDPRDPTEGVLKLSYRKKADNVLGMKLEWVNLKKEKPIVVLHVQDFFEKVM